MSDGWLQVVEQGFQVLESNPLATSATIGGVLTAGMVLRLLMGRRPHPDDRAHGSASWADKREARKIGLLQGDGVVLGQLGDDPYAILRANKAHVLGVGPSGIGKSTLLICTLRSWPGDAIVLDLTGDLIKHTAGYRPGKVCIWEPAALDSMRLNPYDLVRWQTPFETLDVQRVAAHLTAIDADHTSDIGTYFKDIAELVLTFAPIYLWYSTLDPWTNRSLGVSPRDLMTFLRNVPGGKLEALLRDMLSMGHETVQLGARAMLDETPQRRTDGWNAAARWLNPWIDPVLAQATATDAENPRTVAIPVKDLQQGDTPITIYIRVTPEDVSGRLRNQVRLTFEQIMMWAKDREPDEYERDLLVAMDDMAELGYASIVERMAQFDRKYGIRLCALLQDFNQLWKHFGTYTSLLSNCAVWVVFQPNDPRNADLLTGKLGDMTWHKASTRVTKKPFDFFGSRSRGELSHARPLMTAEELQKMGPDRVLIFAHGHKIDARAVRYFDHPLFRGAA